MGWHEEPLTKGCILTHSELNVWVDENGYNKSSVKSWHPDEDANQAFMVVGKMRELGWKFKLHGFMEYYTAIIWRDNDAVFSGIAAPKIAEVSDDNPCLAIMRACYAAVEEGS